MVFLPYNIELFPDIDMQPIYSTSIIKLDLQYHAFQMGKKIAMYSKS